MILPFEYYFLNDADNSSKSNYNNIQFINENQNNNLRQKPKFYPNNQFLIEQEQDKYENKKIKNYISDQIQLQPKNTPINKMNHFANINNYQDNKFSLESLNQAQQDNLQKEEDLSILSFDSQEELNYLQEGEENNQFLNEGDIFGYQTRYTFFENRNNLLVEDATNKNNNNYNYNYNNNNSSTQRNYDFNYQNTNEMLQKKKKSNFQNKSQSQLNNHKNEEKKPSQQRKEQLMKRFESLSRIYNKELSQTVTNGWLKPSQAKTISQDNNLGSSAAKSSKVFYQQQKPFSAQITNSSLKYAAASNGFQNLDFSYKQKQQLIQQETKNKIKEQQNVESNNRISMKPPKSANLNSYKNISNLKNFKEIILTRPNSKQVKFQQQNSVNSQPSSLVSQPLKIQSIEKNNLNSNLNDQNFYDDFAELGSTETTGFSFQNVFQLAGVPKDFIASPRSPVQELNQKQENRENELDQMLNDHHIYVASSVTNQNQIKNEQTERKPNMFGKTLTTLARPFSKEYSNRKDILKSAQQNVRFNKNLDYLDSQNKVVAKNKKRTIFKINQNNLQGNQKDLQSNQTSSVISQQNSIQQYGDDNYQQNQVLNDDQSPLIKQNSIDLNAAEIIQNDENENTQKENVLQQKKNQSNQIVTSQQQSNNYFKQETTTNTSNFSTTSNRIISLQALRQKNNSTVKNSDNNNQNQTNPQNQNTNLKENNDKQNLKKTKIQSASANQAGQSNNQLQKTFFINSQDEYVRRTLLRMGWKENKLLLNNNFDLKWIYIDSNDDYKFLNDNQFYNHFKNNTELTQKGRLLYNLKNNTQFGVNQELFFPRCYDLGNDQERGEFSNEFNRMNVMNLLKKHIQYIKLRRSQTYQEIKQAYQQKQANKLNAQVKDGIFFAKVTKQKFFSPLMYEDTKRDNRFIFNITVIAEAVEILKKLKRQQEEYIDETRQSRDCQLYIYQTNFKLESMISQYVKINVPFDEEKFVFEKIVGMSKEHWSSPSMKLMKKLYSLYKYFKDADPQFKVSGTKNIWIIKPSANSRGSGIYLVDKLDEAIDSGLKMQARIVQKYIERPLIFQGAKYKKLNNKKFDIRQWVLVTSFKPLKIYFFTSSYLRVCSQSFDLDNIKILSKHLTNFSLNKNSLAKENWDETVVELKDFISYLKEFKNIDYQEDVKPKIKDLVIETIKCAADKIVNRKKSFELYGFDILLDEYAHPWLLEVNLSPACSERSSFLTEMLDAMAYKMFQIVFKQNNLQEDLEINKETAISTAPASCQNPDYDWEEIYNEEQKEYFCEEDNNMQLAFNNDIQLMVIGQKADLKKEKNLDKKYFQYWGAIKIQSKIRSFLAKKKLQRLKNQKFTFAAIKIQQKMRQFLAKKQLNILKKQQQTNINIPIEDFNQVSVIEV
ncbi:tubulin glycylase 3E (macronuclear) [Tetrahymena thermophila SB210]|uniref:Tubulin glycylase 3E n=1 Tax=Tetrahymena thermophila (strain SB210) TaxID=312017 RepID=TTL3E_TETTS|nr:tubulin glycylase 3E [Tetrahymena thermophila SB210]Q23AS2.1 RecName: Full=Tubulin glycylase 3E [Tetrahymena thermophila SB210]EAR93620.1 tubulin glycylase 3E [Tetrahymena thermophila SB210]|eukprot:XP_001013865.1 tubulin glycylase 3E [Tetrahymena thermophila SB210]